MKKYEEILKEIIEKVAKDQHLKNCQMDIKSITTDGATLKFLVGLKCPGKDDLKLLVKVATADDEMRAVVPFFEMEHFFYDNLLRRYKHLERKNNVPAEHRLVTAEFYYGSDEHLKESLVLEDITSKGFKTNDNFNSINWEYASKCLENLAKFHALSIALSEDDPEGFRNLSILQRNFDYDGWEHFLEHAFTTALQVVKEENQSSLQKFYDEFLVDYAHYIDKYRRPYRRPFIVHGYVRPSSIMHRIQDGRMEIIIVDYQMLNLGNPVVDIMSLIFIGTDKKFRDQHFKQCLDHYYQELCRAFKRLRLDPGELYSREDFDYEVNENILVGIFQSLCSFMTLIADEEDAPLQEDVTFEDFRVNLKTSYAQRINEIVEDYIEMGYLK